MTIRNANDKTVLIEERKVLKKTVKKFKGSSIIGETEEIHQIKEMIEKVCPFRCTSFDYWRKWNRKGVSCEVTA